MMGGVGVVDDVGDVAASSMRKVIRLATPNRFIAVPTSPPPPPPIAP